jgi:hypothetical protein
MALRVYRGIPPVIEAEFKELAAWITANHARVDATEGSIEVKSAGGAVFFTSAWNLHLMMRDGGARSAGGLAEAVRRLRRQYPDELTEE